MARKIFFRGDDRHPLRDNIFAEGFSKRDSTRAMTYRASTYGRAGDLEPSSGVCVSARFCAATLFPLKFTDNEPSIDAYVYAVCLDVSRVFNTHARQVTDTVALPVPTMIPLARRVWPLFAHELAIDRILPTEIIAAVPCRRHWNGTTWQQGGSYELSPLYRNDDYCMADAIFTNMCLEFLRREINRRGISDMPGGDSGYKLSEPSRLTAHALREARRA